MTPAAPRLVDPRVLAQAVGQDQTMAVLMERRFRRRLSEEFRDYLKHRIREHSTLEDVETHCVYYAQQMKEMRVFEELGIQGYRFRPLSDQEAAFYFYDQDKKQVIAFHFSWTPSDEPVDQGHPHN